MSSRIYYFSGTGNSLAAARSIAAALGQCELMPVSQASTHPDMLDCDNEVVGLATPNYYMGLPVIVSNFLIKAAFKNVKYFFIVVTSGHDFGIGISQAEKILKEKGNKLNFGAYLVMPDNYLPMFNIAQEKADAILKKAGVKLGQICKDIAGSTNKISENTFFHGPVLRLFNKFQSAKFARLDSNFVVEDTCTSCGTCKKVCPVKNIEMEGKRPTWLHHCEQCLACIHFCPVEAIQYGKKTTGKRRYHHPGATAEDIAKQNPSTRVSDRPQYPGLTPVNNI